jgi:hypothetical protein
VAECYLGLEWNTMFLCSKTYNDPTRHPIRKLLFRGLCPFNHYITVVGPKAICVHLGLADFIQRLSKFVDIMV